MLRPMNLELKLYASAYPKMIRCDFSSLTIPFSCTIFPKSYNHEDYGIQLFLFFLGFVVSKQSGALASTTYLLHRKFLFTPGCILPGIEGLLEKDRSCLAFCLLCYFVATSK